MFDSTFAAVVAAVTHATTSLAMLDPKVQAFALFLFVAEIGAVLAVRSLSAPRSRPAKRSPIGRFDPSFSDAA